MNKYGLPINPCSPILASGPVNPGRQVERLIGRQVNKYGLPIIPCSPIFTSDPVNMFIVDLSTCLPGLTGPGQI